MHGAEAAHGDAATQRGAPLLPGPRRGLHPTARCAAPAVARGLAGGAALARARDPARLRHRRHDRGLRAPPRARVGGSSVEPALLRSRGRERLAPRRGAGRSGAPLRLGPASTPRLAWRALARSIPAGFPGADRIARRVLELRGDAAAVEAALIAIDDAMLESAAARLDAEESGALDRWVERRLDSLRERFDSDQLASRRRSPAIARAAPARRASAPLACSRPRPRPAASRRPT